MKGYKLPGLNYPLLGKRGNTTLVLYHNVVRCHEMLYRSTTYFRSFSVFTMAASFRFNDLLQLKRTQLLNFKTISSKSRHTAFDKNHNVFINIAAPSVSGFSSASW